jgi:hypothetical protein
VIRPTSDREDLGNRQYGLDPMACAVRGAL